MRLEQPAAVGACAYGRFDAAAREYVIVRPDTPTPWINYLGSGGYGGIVSNTGGGYSFDRDPRHRRVSRYRYNGVPADQPGRYVYLRDRESGAFWSATWQPVKRAPEAYECRHGAGYTRIATRNDGIESELVYFVPPGEPCELWVLRVRNAGDRPRRLRSFSYVELSFADAAADQQNLDWAQHIVATRCEDGAIRSGTLFAPAATFFGASEPAVGWDCDRETFVGRYGDLAAPAVVAAGAPTCTDAPRGNGIGSLCHDLDLEPGEERELVYVLGISDDPAERTRLLTAFSEPDAVETAFEALHDDWDAYLARLDVETPDPELDAMVNVWNAIQCRTTLVWSRFASAYETGLGRGMGTRDSAQDTLGTVHAAPDRVRETLVRLLGLQFLDGHVWHLVFPLTGEGSAGLAEEQPERPQWFCDDHLWLVIAVCAYLRETGELAFVERLVPYQDGPAESVWHHLQRAIWFTLDHRGPHGLPRVGFADWDDTLNVDRGSGRAESVFCAMQASRALRDLAELAEALGRADEAAALLAPARALRDAVEACAWDGAWYARAFDDDGRALGVAAAPSRRIDLVPQAWCAIGEVAAPERADTALRSLERYLVSEHGIALLDPPYAAYDPRVGGTSTYPPGAKENGGIFCHANAWAVIAAAMLGDGDRAHDWYRRVLPLARTDSDRYLVEPYVWCQNVCGPAHPQSGMGRNAWLTGTASWMLVAATQWLLGVRPTYAGLRVAPALPAAWPGFRMRRAFRDAVYEIEVERGERYALEVDGEPLAGDVVPAAPAGTAVVVRVTVP